MKKFASRMKHAIRAFKNAFKNDGYKCKCSYFVQPPQYVREFVGTDSLTFRVSIPWDHIEKFSPCDRENHLVMCLKEAFINEIVDELLYNYVAVTREESHLRMEMIMNGRLHVAKQKNTLMGVLNNEAGHK